VTCRGLVVVRSLTKTWALAGLRVGYLLAPADLVARLRDAQPLWAVSTLGLIALDTCLARGPVAAARRDAEGIAGERALLEQALTSAGVEVSPGSRAPYLLCRVPDVRTSATRCGGTASRSAAATPSPA
jgi:histidinol-phosphate aminotransferase